MPSAAGPLRNFLERFGHLVSRGILTLLYALLVAPFALFARALGDPLRLRRAHNSNWLRWPSDNTTVDRARRQD